MGEEMDVQPSKSAAHRRARVVGALAVCVAALAACGSSATSVESASDSGDPAAWIGTRGVEFVVKNATSGSFYVWDRGGGDVRTLKSNESTTFSGERSGADDLEIAVSWNADGSSPVEIDGSNPSTYYPSVTVQGDKRCGENFSVKQTLTCQDSVGGRSFTVKVTRETDSDKFKRFSITVS